MRVGVPKTAFGKAIAFHLINKQIIASIEYGEVTDMMADLSFDDDKAEQMFADVKTKILESFNEDTLYQKVCELFNAPPVDSLDLAALYNGPCYFTITGRRGTPSDFMDEPIASLINFAIYTFKWFVTSIFPIFE